MSNNYNSTLQSNNTDLQAILNTINELPEAGGGDPVLQDKTVTPTTSKQTVTADSGYDGLDTVTVNAMPTATQATPSITVNSSGLITATATQAAGYVAAGSKSATKQLTTQAAQTITPGTSNKTIASGRYLVGTQTIKGDSNLVAENIAEGVSIFGVTGTHSGGSSGGVSDIEVTFSLELIQEMYEPGTNLYKLVPATNFNINDCIVFKIVFFFRHAVTDKNGKIIFSGAKESLSDTMSLMRIGSSHGPMFGGCNVSGPLSIKSNNDLMLNGIVTIGSNYSLDITGNGIILK